MSLTGSMNIGRTALAASQIGIQTTSMNIAGSSTPGYSRQIARMISLRGAGPDPTWAIGSGVAVQGIDRQVDGAIQRRLWNAIGNENAASTLQGTFGQLEALLGELGDNDLSSELSGFFRVWSERSNQTQSAAAVVQQADKLAGFMRRLRTDLSQQQTQAGAQIGAAVASANELLSRVADLNRQISAAEVGGQTANVLRDSRDQLITDLSQYIDVSVVDRGREGTDVLVGSTPIVLGGISRGITLVQENSGDGTVGLSVVASANQQKLDIRSGQIGALLASRESAVDGVIDGLDRLASQLMFEVNKLHSTGARPGGLTSTASLIGFGIDDRTRALNDAGQTALAGLPFQPTNGGFVVRVRQGASGTMTTTRIDVDLDGLTAAGTQGTTDDTTPEQIRAAIEGIPGLRARFSPDGKLEVVADEGFSFSFEDDSSGVLGVLGVNAFFAGTNASDVRVRSDLVSQPTMLTAGRYVNDELIENGTALQITQLQSKALTSLGGVSATEFWRQTVQELAGASAQSNTSAQAARTVREAIQAQRDAVSGVSIDEESINLLQFQRQYQAAARIISVVDELTQQLISLA